MAKQTQDTSVAPEQFVKVDQSTYGMMLMVSYGQFDKWSTQLGARKIADVLRNLDDALKVLEQSKYEWHKAMAADIRKNGLKVNGAPAKKAKK